MALWCKLQEEDSKTSWRPECSSGGHNWPQDPPWVTSAQIPPLGPGYKIIQEPPLQLLLIVS